MEFPSPTDRPNPCSSSSYPEPSFLFTKPTHNVTFTSHWLHHTCLKVLQLDIRHPSDVHYCPNLHKGWWQNVNGVNGMSHTWLLRYCSSWRMAHTGGGGVCIAKQKDQFRLPWFSTILLCSLQPFFMPCGSYRPQSLMCRSIFLPVFINTRWCGQSTWQSLLFLRTSKPPVTYLTRFCKDWHEVEQFLIRLHSSLHKQAHRLSPVREACPVVSLFPGWSCYSSEQNPHYAPTVLIKCINIVINGVEMLIFKGFALNRS